MSNPPDAAPLSVGGLRQRIADWANSPEGAKAIQETSGAIRKSIEQMERDQKISVESMSRPVDRILQD